jgi:3-hydroxyisobutyrate dehydrogenase
MKIGFIGTGVMGAPMVRNLSQKHIITVYNRSLEKALKLKDVATIIDRLDARMFNNDVIMTMVGNPDDVKFVYDELLTHCQPKTILIDFTTSSPILAAELYAKGKQREIAVLDAPVTGGEKGAINQSLSIMVGGDMTTFETVKPLLALLGAHLLYMGKAGQGQHAKMANQIAIAGALASLAEALTYAKTHQLNLDQVLTYLTQGAASSYSATHYGPKMVNQDWQATFYLKHYLKDLTIALSCDPNLPIVAYVKTLLEKLVIEYGEKGVQSIIQAYLKS